MQANHLAAGQQFLQAGYLAGVTQGELADHIVKTHLHTQALGDHPQLHADIAVADDTQGFAADLEGIGGGLQPHAAMGRGVLLGDTAQQQDRFGNHQLRHAAGIGEGRVEHGHALAGRGLQVHLVGADTETADGNQFFGGFENLGAELGAGADTDEMGIGDGDLELLRRQGLLVQFDIVVAGPLQGLYRGRVYALQ